MRKLLPSLHLLDRDGHLDRGTRLAAVSRDGLTDTAGYGTAIHPVVADATRRLAESAAYHPRRRGQPRPAALRALRRIDPWRRQMTAIPLSAADVLDLAPVMPVVVVSDVETAVPLARALVAGGPPGIEVTLRTPAGLGAIERIAAEVPEAVVGAGTVVTPEQADAAAEAGARFLVSPGCTPDLGAAMSDTGLPFLSGVSTVSEAMALLERGQSEMKFFPAEAAGGAAFLKSLGGPLPQVRFCPTGGITVASAPTYLALPNVGCVGGSWLTPTALVEAGKWDEVTALAREATALGA